MGAVKKIKNGDKYGCLTVINFAGMFDYASEERPGWRVRCECGQEYLKANRNITRPRWKNCGPKCGKK